MRKLSEINEGMWKGAVNRAKEGGLRGEETNIHSMPEGDDLEDLPFIIANADFHYKGRDRFTYKEALEFQPLFEKYGWRLPTYDEACLISQKCKLKVLDKDFGYIVGARKRNPRVTVESSNSHYWVTSPHAQYPFYPYLVVSLFAKLIFVEDQQYIAPRDTKSIRLIKDK